MFTEQRTGSFAKRIILDLVSRPDYECSRIELRETRKDAIAQITGSIWELCIGRDIG